MTTFVMALIVFAGLAVGATSIGGILVVPVLTVLADIPVQVAVPASTFGFMFTGAAALAWQRLRRPASHDVEVPGMALYLWALVGAALGAWTLRWLPATAAQLVLAALAIVSGLQTLLVKPAGNAEPGLMPAALRQPGKVAMLGLIVGCGSAWSGSGGPVILLPLLMLMGAPTRMSILLAQGIQLPIALSATSVNLLTGQLDLHLGLLLGGLLLLGWGAGTWVAAHMATRTLKRWVAGGLIVVGLGYCIQSLLK